MVAKPPATAKDIACIVRHRAYNLTLQLTVEKLVYGGDGLARLPADEHGRGKAVFVPFVLSAERIEALLTEQKPGFARAQVASILAPSAQRIEPRCPYFQRCGGCHYQHAVYEHQLAIKAEILKENLRRIAKVELGTELQIHASPPWEYRNRTRLRVCPDPFAIGYYRFNSHELLAVEECPISSPRINRAIVAVWQLGRSGVVLPGLREIEFFANSDDTQLLVELSCDAETSDVSVQRWSERLREHLPQLAGVVAFAAPAGFPSNPVPHESKKIAAVEAEDLKYPSHSVSYRVSAGSFFQVNRHLIDELATIVTQERSGHLALDLYAGVGLFSTILALQFDHITAVESSQSSFGDLRYNSPANVKAVRATVEHYLAKPGKQRPDLVVVDPPRSGLGERIALALAGLDAPRITYVSCDPATLGRDLKSLVAAGYRIEQAHLVDLFPQTFHLESVLQLVR